MGNDTETKKREAINLEITFDTQEELLQIIEDDPSLVTKLTDDVIVAIKEAIDSNSEKIHLYNISNFNTKVELPKSQFKPVLKHIIKNYLKDENFEKCAELQSLIDKL